MSCEIKQTEVPIFYRNDDEYFCELNCHFLEIDKKDPYNAFCNLTKRDIMYYDWYIAHCQFLDQIKELNKLTNSKE